MRHSTLHSISRQQNKYIALKNHQNTISFGVVFISWHTKEKVSLKRDYFQWWVGTVHQKEKGKCFIFTRFEINIQFICTNLSNQLRLHVSEGQRNKQVNTFWLFLNKTDEIEWTARTFVTCKASEQLCQFFHCNKIKDDEKVKPGHIQCSCYQLTVPLMCYSHLNRHEASKLMHQNTAEISNDDFLWILSIIVFFLKSQIFPCGDTLFSVSSNLF